MNQLDYFVQIAQAKTATELHALRRDADVDGGLTKIERDAVCDRIAKKFSKLNAAAAGNVRGRWDQRDAGPHPVRIPTANRCH
jgi:hypothetical protein